MLSKLLNFDNLIGTKLIKVLYYLGLIVILLMAIGGLLNGIRLMGVGFGTGLFSILSVIFIAIISVVLWRFMCEIYMLFFRMSDDLRDIKNHQLGRLANTEDV